MGGPNYSRDVYTASSSTGFSSGSTSSATSKMNMGAQPGVKIVGAKKVTKSEKEEPVVICLDVTGSNIEFARIVYDKAPMFHGQIEQQGYLKDFDMAYSACGDAYCDSYPLQITDPSFGDGCEEELKKLCLEGGGGGQRTETYELAAYYYARKFEMPNAKNPFFFFIADEAPYQHVSKRIVKAQCGDDIDEDILSKNMFEELDEKFKGNVFCILNPYGRNAASDSSKRIKKIWQEMLPPERVISIPEDGEKGVIDIILGIIAMISNSRDLDGYLKDMDDRDQSDERQKQVADSLTHLSTAIVPTVKGSGDISLIKKSSRSDIERF